MKTKNANNSVATSTRTAMASLVGNASWRFSTAMWPP
jgi:hypothetical protein